MNDFKIELLEYIDETGKNVFHKWFHSLKDRVARARIRVRLNRVRLGNFGDCKSIGGAESVNCELIIALAIGFISVEMELK